MTRVSPLFTNYHPRDFPGLVRLQSEAEAIDRVGRFVSRAAVAEWLAQPNHAPEKDVFVAKMNGEVIGYSSTLPEMQIKRAVLNGLVHPLHRRKGTARRLLSMSVARAREWGAETAQVNIPEGKTAARFWLLSQGFRLARRFLELEIPLEHIPAPDPETWSIRGLLCGEEGRLAEIQNRSFLGTWGFNPNTTEEIAHRVHMGGCTPEDVRVAVIQGKIVAYCWTRTRGPGNGSAAARRGQVHMLGVLPEFRGRGLGKKVLIAGLHRLMQRGVEMADITVDTQNLAARALYESACFRRRSTTAWYQKALPGRLRREISAHRAQPGIPR